MSTAVDASSKAAVVGIKTTFKDLRAGTVFKLPQRVAVVGQGATAATFSTTKRQITSAVEAATVYGAGSQLHLAILQLLPSNGDGIGTIPLTAYPLADGTTASTGDITPSGTVTAAATFTVRINNIDSETFSIAISDAVSDIVTSIFDALAASLNIPLTSVDSTTKVDVTAKWKGVSGDDIFIEIIGPTTAGISFAITQPTGGAVNPDVDLGLDQVGEVWETMFLNCMEIGDTVTLGKFDVFGEGRWGALVKKPAVAFTGNTIAAVASATSVADARTTDRTNSQLVAPGSNDLPFVVAARQLARIAVIANQNPPLNYGSQDASGLVPGTDAEQWDYVDRDIAIKNGSSTTVVKDGVINISDVVTFFHPAGDPTPAYAYVVDIVKLQNIIFNLDLIFDTAEWSGAPLVPDEQVITNRAAKKPRMARAAIASMIDSLASEAIISDPQFAKDNTTAVINGTNPKRLDIVLTLKLSGNVEIISIDLDFGFFFGIVPVVI